jgi:hypothetical protein
MSKIMTAEEWALQYYQDEIPSDIAYGMTAYAAYYHAEMSKWVRVEDEEPEEDEEVYVFGKWNGEINGRNEIMTTGLVEWKSKDYSQCPDSDAYSAWFSDITHWKKLPEPPKPNEI